MATGRSTTESEYEGRWPPWQQTTESAQLTPRTQERLCDHPQAWWSIREGEASSEAAWLSLVSLHQSNKLDSKKAMFVVLKQSTGREKQKWGGSKTTQIHRNVSAVYLLLNLSVHFCCSWQVICYCSKAKIQVSYFYIVKWKSKSVRRQCSRLIFNSIVC